LSTAPIDDDQGERCDVLIIGGGPAGSTAAAVLAERGRHVVLLEKDRHPRFHIGESLLPRNLAIFDRLGVTERVARIGVLKPGAEFASDRTGRSVFFRFADALNAVHTYAYQVPRAPFDAMLIDNAREKGADIREATRVSDVAFGPDGARVTAVREDGSTCTIAARFVLDASGRDTFLATRLRVKESDKNNSSAAVYAHFRGVEARCGEREGYITAHFAENGWFWMIPLPGEVMSVGFVGNQTAFKGRRGDLTGFLEERIRSSPTVSARMAEAERISEVTATGNYSYRARAGWGEGYMMIGDAFAFLDPIFSTGVLLAMTSGENGAAVADAWIADTAAGRALARRMEARQRRTLDVFAWLIYRINTPALRMLFMSPSNRFSLRDGLIAMLAGQAPRGPRELARVMLFKGIYYVASVLHRFGIADEVQSAPAE
jgi:flavin-dependent dehydrogenase